MTMCNHKLDNDKTALKLLPNAKNKFFGVLKLKRLAICTICGENIELTEDEYNKLLVEGV